MFLNKVLISLAVAGCFQGASATPITGPSEGAILVRDDQASDPSSLESDPGARRPPLFFYDPLHMSEISHLVNTQGGDVCNMLLSVKRIVKKTDTAEQVEVCTMAENFRSGCSPTWISLVSINVLADIRICISGVQ
jgi:hypothetical protein